MSTLYELANEINLLDELIEQNEGEVTPEIEEQLAALTGEHEQKLENICKWVKSLIADSLAYREEARVFTDKARRAEAKVDWLKEYVLKHRGSLTKAGVIQLKVRSSESVEVENIDELPEEFKQYKPSAKKTEIKKELKAGIAVPGAKLVERENLTVV